MLRFVADLTQSFFVKQDRPTRRISKATVSHQYQNLESRQLLASISFNASNGFLSLAGDDTADVGSVVQIISDVSSDVIYQAEINGMSQTFINEPITNIFFEGNDGDDQFQNSTNLPSFIRGGMGNDTLIGGIGADTIVGSEGDDTLDGGAGADLLVGGSGNDTLNGNAGADRLLGQAGEDILNGDAGQDLLSGGDDTDTLNGGDNDDTLIGGAGDDTLNGGAGSDGLFGIDGADELFGDDGDDVLVGNDGEDFLDGGMGMDRLFGNEGNDTLNGGEGDDNLFGSIGDDMLNGQAGDDLVAGGVGNDLLVGGNGNNTLFGGEDNDRIFGGVDRDLAFGQEGDDVIFANDGNDVVNGGDGDDELHGGLGNDSIAGGDGADQLYGELGDDSLFGGDGNDTVVGGVGGTDRLAGNAGNDYFIASEDSNILDFNIRIDAQVEFRNGSSNWTNREIQVLNEGLFRLQQTTGSVQVLRANTATEPVVVFIKETTIAPQDGGRLAISQEVDFTDLVLNSETNQFDPVVFTERRITFAEWDETDVEANLARLDEVPREVAFMWAGAEPITTLIASQAGYWDSFLRLSGWTQNRPDPITFFDVTPDGESFYLRAAIFAEDAGRLSPEEDFATMWKFIVQQEFAEPDDVVVNDELIPKLESVNQFFSILGQF